MGMLLKADAHGVMDQLEERSLLIKQNLREAELELDRKRAQVETMDEEARRISDALRAGRAQIEALDRDVELALAEGKEELARFAVRRLLPRQQSVRAFEARLVELDEERARLRETLEQQESQLADLKARARVRIAEERSADASASYDEGAVAEEEIELELLRRRTSSYAGGQEAGR
jgi:phage shock protein A